MAKDLKKDIRSSDLILNGKRTAKNQKIQQTREIVPLFPASVFWEAQKLHLANLVVFIIDALDQAGIFCRSDNGFHTHTTGVPIE